MSTVRAVVAACAILGWVRPAQEVPEQRIGRTVRAKYLITVSDDFVVDLYLNGKAIPDSARHLLDEQFGATVERIDVPIHKGDWLVFNVVNDRLRWDGARYFGLAGCFAKNEIALVSDPANHNWSVCDDPGDVADFIADPIFGTHRALPIAREWEDGTPLMKRYAGDGWNGKPLWGASHNTWIKLQVE